MRRVNELLREVIAEEVARLKDPGLGFVTITGVDTSPDLRAARVFYTVLGDQEQRDATEAALERARTRIKTVVGSQVRLKYLPDLGFEYDSAVERGLRMEELLHEIGEADGDDEGVAGQGG